MDRPFEWVHAPAFAGGNNVEVARKAEVRRARTSDGDHIFGRPVGGIPHGPPVNFKVERRQRLLQDIENLAARGSDARAPDEARRKIDWVSVAGHGKSRSKPLTAGKRSCGTIEEQGLPSLR